MIRSEKMKNQRQKRQINIYKKFELAQQFRPNLGFSFSFVFSPQFGGIDFWWAQRENCWALPFSLLLFTFNQTHFSPIFSSFFFSPPTPLKQIITRKHNETTQATFKFFIKQKSLKLMLKIGLHKITSIRLQYYQYNYNARSNTAKYAITRSKQKNYKQKNYWG